MHYFLTVATGLIGRSLTTHLLTHNHHITALARSPAAASLLTSLGAVPLLASLDDLPALTAAAAASDGVVHLAFKDDFKSDPAALPAVLEADRAAIRALAEGLADSGNGRKKPLVVAAGTMMALKGVLATEDTPMDEDFMPMALRNESARLVAALSEELGVRGSVVRLPPAVHGEGDTGLIPMAIAGAKGAGYVPVVPGRTGRWAAVQREDVAGLLRLVLEDKDEDEGRREARTWHAVAEGEVQVEEILRVVAEGTGLRVREVGEEGFREVLGYAGGMLLQDNPVSSERTRKELGWVPRGMGLMEDLKRNYF